MSTKRYVVLLLILAQFCLAAGAASNSAEEVKPNPPKTISTNKLADSFGHAFATLIKFFQLFGFLMIVFDIWYRYKYGNPMYFMHTLRFAIFTYGACCPWLLGGNED